MLWPGYGYVCKYGIFQHFLQAEPIATIGGPVLYECVSEYLGANSDALDSGINTVKGYLLLGHPRLHRVTVFGDKEIVASRSPRRLK